MARASEEAADTLHALTFEIVQEEILAYRERGERVPPAPLGQAVKLLKDNDISSPASAQKVADTLAPHLPDFGPEDMAGSVPH
ncbi:hypothetical protein [Stenotrophomonas sp. AG209]|uniref:hypothetical protein n=1 Tax=Stenotrophomonas sp. AG209 TaxID=2183909 RepID=UPI000E5A1F93|nr:hypothetical protein [Stenotrophomonas sp. AG209]